METIINIPRTKEGLEAHMEAVGKEIEHVNILINELNNRLFFEEKKKQELFDEKEKLLIAYIDMQKNLIVKGK